MRALAIWAAAWVLPSGASTAQDFAVFGGAALEFDIAPEGKGSDNQTNLNAHLEVERAGLFLGMWAENSNLSLNNEVNVYLGYRSETAAGLSYALFGTRVLYQGADLDYSTLDVEFEVPLGDAVSGEIALTYYSESALSDVYFGLFYTATEQVYVSANYGVYGVEDEPSEHEWDFGLGFDLGNETELDLRFYDGTDYADRYFGISMSWDTTLFSR